LERGAGTWCTESSHQLHDNANEVRRLHFQKQSLLLAEEQEPTRVRVEEEDLTQVQDEEPLPLTQVQEREPFFVTHLFSLFGDDYLRFFTSLVEDCELGGGAHFATTGLTPIGVGVGLGHLT